MTIYDKWPAKAIYKACVYSPDIPLGSADFTLITPRYWNSRFYSLISLGRMQHFFCTCSHAHSTNFRSTWYPLLLGGQKHCGFKAYPRLSHMTKSNPRPLDLGSYALTTWPRTPQVPFPISMLQCDHMHYNR